MATEPWNRLSATRKRHKQKDRVYLTADDNDALGLSQSEHSKTERANVGLYNAKRGRPRGLPLLKVIRRLGAVHRSAAPWPPTGWPRSTLGAMGLSFRVRNGTGRAPHAMAADRWAAPTVLGVRVSLSRALGAAWRIGKHDSGASSCPDRA